MGSFWQNYVGEIIAAAIGAIVSAAISIVVGYMKKKNEISEQYNKLRSDVSEALTMYCCYYLNPIDIAKTADHRLPDNYRQGSDRLRELAAKVEAFAETLPKNAKKLPFKTEDLHDVHSYLIGLSNSFSTPYGCDVSREELDAAREWENEIRVILNIHKFKG